MNVIKFAQKWSVADLYIFIFSRKFPASSVADLYIKGIKMDDFSKLKCDLRALKI